MDVVTKIYNMIVFPDGGPVGIPVLPIKVEAYKGYKIGINKNELK